MKVPFDRGTPALLRSYLPEHPVDTLTERGRAIKDNGELLDDALSKSNMLLSRLAGKNTLTPCERRTARCAPSPRQGPFYYGSRRPDGAGARDAGREKPVAEGGASQREMSWKLHEYTDILGMVAAPGNDAEPRDLCDRRRGGRSGRTDLDRDGSTVDTPHGGREGNGSACWLARHLDQVPDRPRTTRRGRVTWPRRRRSLGTLLHNPPCFQGLKNSWMVGLCRP